MLKYVNTEITFLEVPDEITLCINISNCPCHCKGCHSPYLAEDIGEELKRDSLINLIDKNEGITCVCFMGGDSNPTSIEALSIIVKHHYPKLKVAWYSGRQELPSDIDLEWFDYIKLGPYIEELGPLNKLTTNQRFYKIKNISSTEEPRYVMEDNTYLFWHDFGKTTCRCN